MLIAAAILLTAVILLMGFSAGQPDVKTIRVRTDDRRRPDRRPDDRL